MDSEKQRRACWALAIVALVAVLAGSTAVRNNDYRSTLSLWLSALRSDPGNSRAALGVGEALMGENRLLEAETYLREAVLLSRSGRDVSAQAALNLGILAYRRGDAMAAAGIFREIIDRSPEFPQALYNLAVVLAETSQPGGPEGLEALEAYRRLARLLPPASPRLAELRAILSTAGFPAP